MAKTGFLTAAALCGLLVLPACQTASIDTMETTSTSIGADAASPAARDLAAGKTHFRDANYGLAEKHFRKAVELDGGSAEGWMGLAASYDQLGRFDFADRAYGEAVRIAGRSPRLVSNMGYSHYLRGDGKKARELYAEARAGMTDTRLVDANLALLKKG